MPGAAGIYSRMKHRERRALGVGMLVHSNCTHTVSSHLTAVAVASKLLFFSNGLRVWHALEQDGVTIHVGRRINCFR